MFKRFTPLQIVCRRAFVIIAGGLALPVLLFPSLRAPLYSRLHRIWLKTSTKPVWLAQTEQGSRELY
ncbi:YbfA family protein [Parasalinivibrio latis]